MAISLSGGGGRLPWGAELGHLARLGLGKLARSLEAPSRGSLGEP